MVDGHFQPPSVCHGDQFKALQPLPTLPDLLHRAANTRQGIIYLNSDGTEQHQPYHKLRQQALQILAKLHQAGAKATDRVVLQLPDPAEFLAALWACWLGEMVAVPTPVPARYSTDVSQAHQLRSILACANGALILTSPELQAAVRAFTAWGDRVVRTGGNQPNNQEQDEQDGLGSIAQPLLDAAAEQLALILFTSGSTGRPKGVKLTTQNLLVSAVGMATANGLTDRSITLNWMPLEHVASLVMFHLTPVYLGCEQIHVANDYILLEPLRWLDLIDRFRVTATWAPNFAYGLINAQFESSTQSELTKERRWDLSCIQWMGNGAEAVVGKTTRSFLRWLAPYGLADTVVSPGYGMSETTAGIVHSHRFSQATSQDDDPFVEVGEPIPGVSLRIVNEHGQIVAEGTIGRLQVRGLTITSGYEGAPDLTAAAFTSDGWFQTGDLGFLQAGRLTITGREKDVIILNGMNVYSHEIEAIVEELPEVEVSYTAACAVRRSGETTDRLIIFLHQVDPDNQLDLPKLIKRVRRQLVNRLGVSPDAVIPVARSEIPKTSLGKIQRRELSQRFQAGAFDDRLTAIGLLFQQSATPTPARNPVEQQLLSLWRSVLGVESIGLDEHFFELGGNSLRLLQVLQSLQQQGYSVSAVNLFQYGTIATLAEFLRQSQPDSSAISAAAHRGRRRAQQRAQRRTQQRQHPVTTGIAVIGMACRFPGATSIEQFWQNLCRGVESITFFTEEEVLAAGVDPELVQHPNCVKASPILKDIEWFDAEFFGYTPREAELLDPQQRLMLECAWEALEDAGYDPLTYPATGGAIALYAGASMNTYLLNHVYPNRHHFDPEDGLEVFNLSSMGGFQVTVANDKDYLPTRVSYKLNLTGASINVQTACSTSLVAIHLAAQALLQGECDLALAGGVSVHTPQTTSYLYQEGMILSPDGHCRAFDAQAQGTIFGSGAGVVVLKRLEDAIADGDQIYAVVKGSAVGNDGGTKVGYFAPQVEGQATVISEAMATAGFTADSITYVEAHGTGTSLGDPIEVTALTQAFRANLKATIGKHGRQNAGQNREQNIEENIESILEQTQTCAIGSVKTNVGHLNVASGVVGFIKTVLALHHQKLPPSLHFNTPNPKIDFAHSPFFVNTQLRDWSVSAQPRRAGVNSLGIGGTNVHVCLEEAPSSQPVSQASASSNSISSNSISSNSAPSESVSSESTLSDRTVSQFNRTVSQFDRILSNRERPLHLLTLSAKTPIALQELVDRYRKFLTTHSDLPWADLCFTANCGRAVFQYRLAIVADSITTAQAHLPTAISHGRSVTTTPTLAMVFAGQGSQYANMGWQLYQTQPVFRQAIDRCDQLLQTQFGWHTSLCHLLYGDADTVGNQEKITGKITGKITDTEDWLQQTIYTQPALFAVEYALFELWRSWGVCPNVVMGHSLGEYVAAYVAGVFSLEDGLKLVVQRARLMQTLPAGAMLAVWSEVDPIRTILAQIQEPVSIAAVNSDHNLVLTGEPIAIQQVMTHLQQQGIQTKQLQVSRACHSPLMEPILAEFRAIAQEISYNPPKIPFISNLTGAVLEVVDHRIAIAEDSFIDWAEYWCQQLRQPVQFAAGLQQLPQFDCNLVLECGAKPILTGIGRSIPSNSTLLWLPSLQPNQTDWDSILSTLRLLYLEGVPIDWVGFDRPYSRRRRSLPTYPFQRQRYWLDVQRNTQKNTQPRLPHPLLGQKIATPRATLFHRTLTLEALPFLPDHRIYGAIVLPGSAYLEMALAAAIEVLETSEVSLSPSIGLENLHILQPLVWSDAPQSLQISITEENTGLAFEIYSQTVISGTALSSASSSASSSTSGTASGTASSKWILHCTGTIATVPALEIPDFLQLQQQFLLARSPDVFFVDSWSDLMASMPGIAYGTAFQGVQQVWYNQRSALGRVELVECLQSQATTYQIHPAFLDACLQLVLLFTTAQTTTHTTAYVPVSLDRLQYTNQAIHQIANQGRQDLMTCLWSYVEVRLSTPEVLITDVCLFTAQGECILAIAGLTAKAIAPQALNPVRFRSTWENWLWIPEWHPAPLPDYSITQQPKGRWLIFADSQGIGQQLATRLEAQHQSCVIVNRSDAQSLDDLLHDLLQSLHWGDASDRGILYFWSCDATDMAMTADAYASVLCLLQALIRSNAQVPIWFITQNSQSLNIHGTGLAQAPLWGLGKTMALEHPELRCYWIDLDGLDREGATDIDRLMTEFLGTTESSDSQVAYRSGIRHVAKLTPAILSGLSGLSGLNVSPVNVSPVNVSPVNLSPVNVSPVNVSPVNLSPVNLSPVNSQSPMLQLQIAERGSCDQLIWQSVDRQSPDDDEIELRVLMTGLNFRDVLNVLDRYPGEAGALGLECVGEVVAVGRQVSESQSRQIKVGDIVIAIAPASFSQFVTTKAMLAVPKPKSLSLAAAATIPIAFLTAYYALRVVANLQPGERILIHAAAGGVGWAAIQIAQQVGAEIFATASPSKWLSLQQQGITHLYSSRSLDFVEAINADTAGQGVDVVLNALAGDFILKSASLLRSQGRFVEIGKPDAVQLHYLHQLRTDIDYSLVDLMTLTQQYPEQIQSLFCQVMQQIDQAQLQALPYQLFAREQVIDAFRYMQQAKQVGKIIVEMASPRFHVDPEGIYLITGGLGGLGLQVAAALIDWGAKHLRLIGRTPPLPPVAQQLQQWQQSGITIIVEQLDIADTPAVTDWFSRDQSLHHRLRGIFHAAGVLDDGAIENQTQARFERVMAAKIQGAWNLHQLTQNQAIDCFVLFSSAASLCGAAGQANYAAANAGLDALAHLRRSRGLPALSINWGAWLNLGMTAQQQAQRTLTRTQRAAIAPTMGLDILKALLSEGFAQVGVLPESALESAGLPRGLAPRSAHSQALGRQSSGQSSESFSSTGLQSLSTLSEFDRRTHLSDRLRQLLAKILGVDPGQIDPDQGFSDLGLDSLTVVEFKYQLQLQLDRTLPMTLLYSYPTLTALTDYLLSLLQPASEPISACLNPESLDALSDADAEALLLTELDRLNL